MLDRKTQLEKESRALSAFYQKLIKEKEKEKALLAKESNLIDRSIQKLTEALAGLEQESATLVKTRKENEKLSNEDRLTKIGSDLNDFPEEFEDRISNRIMTSPVRLDDLEDGIVDKSTIESFKGQNPFLQKTAIQKQEPLANLATEIRKFVEEQEAAFYAKKEKDIQSHGQKIQQELEQLKDKKEQFAQQILETENKFNANTSSIKSKLDENSYELGVIEIERHLSSLQTQADNLVMAIQILEHPEENVLQQEINSLKMTLIETERLLQQDGENQNDIDALLKSEKDRLATLQGQQQSDLDSLKTELSHLQEMIRGLKGDENQEEDALMNLSSSQLSMSMNVLTASSLGRSSILNIGKSVSLSQSHSGFFSRTVIKTLAKTNPVSAAPAIGTPGLRNKPSMEDAD